MRLIKSDAEIAVMREAARITCILINECMKATEPGMSLQKLPAMGKYVYQLRGQCSEGYDYLVNPNTEDSDTLVDGDLVLMDCGPDYRHYTTDIASFTLAAITEMWRMHRIGHAICHIAFIFYASAIMSLLCRHIL